MLSVTRLSEAADLVHVLTEATVMQRLLIANLRASNCAPEKLAQAEARLAFLVAEQQASVAAWKQMIASEYH